MSSTLWRVVWNLAGEGPQQSVEFSLKKNAVAWAQGLSKGGASGIVVTELILGETIRFDGEPAYPSLPFDK